MKFPLNKKSVIGYDYGVPTSYNEHHLGVDWEADFVPLYAPCKGIVKRTGQGPQAGKFIEFQSTGKDLLIRWVHLSQIKVLDGQMVDERQQIAVTGNTGSNTTGAHLHEDMWPKGKVTLKFEDTFNPHKFYNMTNALLVKKGSEYGIYLPATTADGLISQLRNIGVEPPLNPNGTLNWTEVDKLVGGTVI